MLDQIPQGNLPIENNIEKTGDPVLSGDKSGSFLTEQHNDASWQKCFDYAMKADFHKTKNVK